MGGYMSHIRNITTIAFIILFSSLSLAQTVRYSPEQCKEDLKQVLSPEIKTARKIFLTLTGMSIPYCDERLKKMERLIKTGQPREAARVATADPLFYDIRVRDMATRWCHLDESVRNEINDCVAMVVGGMRDGMDIRNILTGNYHYEVDLEKVKVVNGSYPRYSPASNDHFAAIPRNGLSMFYTLKSFPYQKIADPAIEGATKTLEDPAGLISSRGFLSAHAVAGTNRRIVEKTFKEFLCTPIQELADNSLPDIYVGRDVDRAPAGDPQKYNVTCKSCHAPMDSMRGAFAYVDYSMNSGSIVYTKGTVRNKYVRTGISGHDTTSDKFDNLATVGANATRFAWSGPTSGNGMGQFSRMIAGSKAFSHCMVTNVYKTVCGADPAPEHKQLIDTLANDLDNAPVRDLRAIFERISLRPECVGQ